MNTHAAPDSSTALALERTRLAHERTLMAWVRTATSLISFGFTIYKAFEYLRQRQPDVAHGVLGPRNFALVLIGLGIGALVLATVQHRGDRRDDRVATRNRRAHPGLSASVTTRQDCLAQAWQGRPS